MPVIVIFLPFLAMLFLWRRRLGGWRDTFFTAAIVWAGCLVVLTEVLSIGSHITVNGLMAGWIAVLVGVIAVTRWIPTIPPLVPPTPPDDKLLFWALIPQILIILVITAVVGWLGPPNNWDAMTYHMTRVFHWMQNRNVAFYPVSKNLRQLTIAPGSEYIFLHLQLLSGSDRPVDLVQWCAYCGCIFGAASLAGLLGAGRFGRQLAALAAATLPIACLEAESAQNDVIAAFWMLCVVWLIVRLCKLARVATPNVIWFQSVLCGTALGLALLTKATGYIFMVPFLLGLTGVLLWKLNWRALAPLAMLGVIALAINTPTYVRNYRFTQTFIGNGGFKPGDSDRFPNKPIGWRTATSGLLRNCALELAVPPSSVCGAVESVVRRILLRLKIDPDANITYANMDFTLSDYMWKSEDCAPNPIHFLLAIGAVLVLWFKAPRDQGGRAAAIFAAGVFLAFLAFCAYLKWQTWLNRYHLPLLVMSCAPIGVALERYFNRHLIAILFSLMTLVAFVVVINNYNHPLVGDWAIYNWDRESRFFTPRPHLQGPFRSMVECAQENHCRQIGLISGADDWEYPLDMMMRARLPDVRVEAYPDSAFGIVTAKQLHTSNQGWDENLRPYLVVKVDGEQATVVKFVP